MEKRERSDRHANGENLPRSRFDPASSTYVWSRRDVLVTAGTGAAFCLFALPESDPPEAVIVDGWVLVRSDLVKVD